MAEIKNKAGATIYEDISKHKVLNIPEVASPSEKGAVYHVLSVGALQQRENRVFLVTIKDGSEAIAYQLPDDLSDWATHAILLAKDGENVFPCDVEFGKMPDGYYAEDL